MTSEALKPSLLDRLTDYAPHRQTEPAHVRLGTARSLHDSVVRDLGWLLNSVRLASVRDLTDVSGLESELKRAILSLKPRLLPESLTVCANTTSENARTTTNSLQFTITGVLLAYPMSLQLCLRTEIDLDTGDVSIAA
jgi:type VI secretion system protein ImpF